MGGIPRTQRPSLEACIDSLTRYERANSAIAHDADPVAHVEASCSNLTVLMPTGLLIILDVLYAHVLCLVLFIQYTVQGGDTLDSISRALATTPETLINLNRNRITHFAHASALGTPSRRESVPLPLFSVRISLRVLRAVDIFSPLAATGDVICVLPSFIDVRDRYGNYICPTNAKHVGSSYTN